MDADEKKLKGIFFGASILTLVASVMFGNDQAVAGAILFVILAGITAGGLWGNVLTQCTKLLFEKWGEAPDAAALAWAVVLFCLGALLFYINPEYLFDDLGLDSESWISDLLEGKPVAGILMGFGWLFTFGAIFFFIKKRLVGVKSNSQ